MILLSFIHQRICRVAMAEVTIEKWGRWPAIRLPEGFVAELGLKDGDSLRAIVKDGKCYLEPVPTSAPNSVGNARVSQAK